MHVCNEFITHYLPPDFRQLPPRPSSGYLTGILGMQTICQNV